VEAKVRVDDDYAGECAAIDYVLVKNLKTRAIHVHVFFRSWYHFVTMYQMISTSLVMVRHWGKRCPSRLRSRLHSDLCISMSSITFSLGSLSLHVFHHVSVLIGKMSYFQEDLNATTHSILMRQRKTKMRKKNILSTASHLISYQGMK